MSVSGAARILVVDDLESNVLLVQRFLGHEAFDVSSCSDATRVAGLVERDQPDAVLMDVRMPGIDGFSVCRALKQNPATMLIPVVLMTAANEPADRLTAIEAGADDFVTKPLNREELQARLQSLVRVKRFTDDLECAEQIIVSLALTIEARDSYTDGHCQRLAHYAVGLARQLALSPEDVAALERGAILHDVGKIAIPDSILLKPGALSPAEVGLMQQHTVIGERLCGGLRSLRTVRPIVRHHHEKLDGTGYPDKLRGDGIPFLAQIIGVVDVYDALTTDRPYRRALFPDRALEELWKEARRGWRRADLVEVFARHLEADSGTASRREGLART
jgi:putative two-component system response regulator